MGLVLPVQLPLQHAMPTLGTNNLIIIHFFTKFGEDSNPYRFSQCHRLGKKQNPKILKMT